MLLLFDTVELMYLCFMFVCECCYDSQLDKNMEMLFDNMYIYIYMIIYIYMREMRRIANVTFMFVFKPYICIMGIEEREWKL